MLYYLLAALFYIAVNSKLMIPDEENYKQQEDLSTFASKVFKNLSKTDKNSIILYVENDDTLMKFHEKTSKLPSRLSVISLELKNYTLPINDSVGFRPEVTIIFLNENNYNNIEEIIFNIELFPIFNVRSKFFVVASGVPAGEDNSWIEETFQQFWERQARHVVLCFWDEEVKIFTFNPFYKQFSIEVSQEADVAEILNEKVRHMNGHKIKLFNMDMVYKDRIVETKVLGKKSYLGMDGMFFSSVATFLSASLEIHDLSSDLDLTAVNSVDQDIPVKDFISTMSDMYDFDALCNAAGVFSNSDNLDLIFQSQRDDMYIVTPRAKQIPRYLYLFLLVPGVVWIASGVSLAVTSAVMWGMRKGWWGAPKRNVLFDNVGLLLNQSMTGKISKFQERLILVAWLIYCIVITTLFQSILMTSFISPKFYPEIDTLEDLYKSEIKVYGAPFMITKILKNLESEELKNLLIPIDKKISLFGLTNEWLDHYMYKDDCGLLVFLEQHIYLHSLPSTRSKYHRMHSAILPYIRAYWVRTDKLLYTELVAAMGLLEQAGLTQYWEQCNYGIQRAGAEDAAAGNASRAAAQDAGRALEVQHLQLGFVLLGVGWVVALGVFVGEVAGRRVRRCCRPVV